MPLPRLPRSSCLWCGRSPASCLPGASTLRTATASPALLAGRLSAGKGCSLRAPWLFLGCALPECTGLSPHPPLCVGPGDCWPASAPGCRTPLSSDLSRCTLTSHPTRSLHPPGRLSAWLLYLAPLLPVSLFPRPQSPPCSRLI